jgi:hypothetical protein
LFANLWKYGMLSGFAVGLLIATSIKACNCSDGGIIPPGCEKCPDPEKCVTPDNPLASVRCVQCIKDAHCQSETSPTARCNSKNICVCGTHKDCGNGYCDATNERCTNCLEDAHCSKSPDRPFCVYDDCRECKPTTIRGCAPIDVNVCVNGTQLCKNNGFWAECTGWEKCSNCPSPPVCKVGEIKCTTPVKEKPGKYLICTTDSDDCPVWSKAEKTCDPANYVCDNGACVPESCPPQECAKGGFRCVGNSHYQICDTDADGCLVWKTKQPCDPGEECSEEMKRCTDCIPKPEICNQKDDNCNGLIDEDFPDLGKPCVVAKGACQSSGKMICSNDGKNTVCSATPGTPSPEICNGIDDDCNGLIDDNATCPNGEPCVDGVCGKPEPGCADGTRELFTDMKKWPLIAGCAGNIEGGNMRQARQGQNGCGAGDERNNACRSAEDLCAPGWHICMRNGDPNELKSRVSSQDCATAGKGLFITASSHCVGSIPSCSYGSGTLPCTDGGPCSEPICCGSDCQFGLCTSAVWQNETRCARPKTFIGCSNSNSYHGNPTITGILCCKDTP